MLTVGSLFSGIGGIEIGFEQAGFNTSWFVEREPYAQAILKKRFPNTPVYDDVTKIDFGKLPKVDILTGGFPCQDISHAGKGVGIGGSRSSLWKHYLRAIREIRPKFALIENVSALLGRGLNVVLADLAKVGYDAEWYCVSASSIGAPHRRDRVFIIAHTNIEWKSQQKGCIEKSRGWTSNSSDQVSNTAELRLAEQKDKQKLEGQRSGQLQSGQSRGVTDVSNTNSIGLQEERPQQQSTGASRDSSDVSDTDSEYDGKRGRVDVSEREEAKEEDHYISSSCEKRESRQTVDTGCWAVEPDVGGTLDGFSSWLDEEISKLYISHKQLLAYGNAKEERPEEILRALRDSFGTEIPPWTTGGQRSIPAQAVLFSYLCQLQEGEINKAWLQLESKEVPEEELRIMWGYEEPSRSSHKSKDKRQSKGKHPDSLQTLSSLLARHAEEAWIDYRKTNATNHWESGIARVAHGVSNRVDRIKCLGNAVVPQVAEIFAEAIKMTIKGPCRMEE